MLYLGGDAIMRAPGFSWDLLGKAGDVLVDHFDAYTSYEEHHVHIVGMLGNDGHAMYAAAPFLAVLQYGRVQDAVQMVTRTLPLLQRIAETPDKPGYVLGFLWGVQCNSICYHILGLSQHVKNLFAILGLSFDSTATKVDEVSKVEQGALLTAMDHKGPGGGLISTKRCVWQIKCFCILHTNVPLPKAVAWLESLPDNAEFLEYALAMGSYDCGAVFGVHQTVWIALACEKVGLYESALRFADLQLEPEVSKGGTPATKWAQVLALCCKGRALAKLDRNDNALSAFQAAIRTAKESYKMMVAFAYRELTHYTGGGGGGGNAAAEQAAKDLDATLAEFDGRLSRAEFDSLTIAP